MAQMSSLFEEILHWRELSAADCYIQALLVCQIALLFSFVHAEVVPESHCSAFKLTNSSLVKGDGFH